LPWSPDDSAFVLEASFARTGDNGELVQDAKKMGVKPKEARLPGAVVVATRLIERPRAREAP